jgi:hypothetical protein
MGGIRDAFGRIAIETRRESFIIHASYGVRDAHKKLRDLMPGDYFRLGGDRNHVYKVRSIDENCLYVGLNDGPLLRDNSLCIPCDPSGHALDQEDEDPLTPLGMAWQRQHPEFENGDLSDLIAALSELRDNPR